MTEQSITHAPEIKASSGNAEDVAGAFDEFMIAFEAFKEANDERLDQIEANTSADVVTREKVDRINRTLEEQKRVIDHALLKKARPALGPTGNGGIVSVEHKNAFDRYVRRGDEQTLCSLEAKSMSTGTGPDGGYLVPPEIETEIGRRLASLSPIRSLASVRQVSSAVLKKPFAVTGPATGWVGETTVRPETAAGTLAELSFPTMELYAMPAATASLLDDAAINIEEWIAAEVETAFAEQEGAAFIDGDGVNKPNGFLSYPTVHEAGWEWGKIGFHETGVAGAFPAENASDLLLDVVYSLKAGYRQNANWVMNRKTQAEIRKLKDKDGNYLWQPPAAAGQQAMLMGFALVEAEDMPDIAENATPVAFGDFRRGYLIVDRMGVRVLRDPYSAKPYVLFYTTKRVGGGVQDFDAIKLLKFAA
ncbi:MAG: phage major capsid protein [Phyllobacterium sp.]